jgi:hypothetical protein
MIIIERLRPGRLWPKVQGWWARALALSAFQVLSVYVAGLTIDAWLRVHRPWSADAMGGWGVAVATSCTRSCTTGGTAPATRWPLLWRWVHQVHHSPTRIEVITSFYKHPIENRPEQRAVQRRALRRRRLRPEVGALVMTVNGIAELFYHWNVRTPRWLGYIVQRPESHCVHHQSSFNRHNYADLPVFDLLFGTYLNPGAWAGRCGLGEGTERRRFAQMLIGRDVNIGNPQRVPEPSRDGTPSKARRLPTRQSRVGAVNRRERIAAGALLALGLTQMVAQLVGSDALRAVAAATNASPAPKVFSAVSGLETYSTTFFIDWTEADGSRHAQQLTSEMYARLRGPTTAATSTAPCWRSVP